MLGAIAAEGAKRVSASPAKAPGRSITGAISGVGEKVRAAGGAVARRFSSEEEAEDAEPDGAMTNDPGQEGAAT